MISFKNHIIFDKIESWPIEMLRMIKADKNLLKGFLEEEHRIGNAAREDISFRHNRPKNPYQERWELVINDIETVLKQHSIVGIHCTKLLDWEIEDVQKNGLKPLDRNFANQRIEKAFKAGFLSKELRDKLIDKKELNDDKRTGCIFVFYCLETLNCESGLNRLLGLWGGESLYENVKDNQELRNIGTSCIIFTSIKINGLDIYPELSKRMTAFYFNDDYFSHDPHSTIKKNLSVLRIVRRNEKLFNDLTGIESWDDECY